MNEHARAVQQQRASTEPLRGEVHAQGEVVKDLLQLTARCAADRPVDGMVGNRNLERLQRTRVHHRIDEVVHLVLN